MKLRYEDAARPPRGLGPSSPTLSAPEGVAVAPNGDMFVSDTGANRIMKYTIVGARIVVVARIGRRDEALLPAALLARTHGQASMPHS